MPNDEGRDEAKDRLKQRFESATESEFDKPRPDVDEGTAIQHGDSRPDLTDPETAKFRRADGDPEMTTSREEGPEVRREDHPESRKPEYSGIIGRPSGPEFAKEIAVVEDEAHHEGVSDKVEREREKKDDRSVAEILENPRERTETGGMGRDNVPKDKDNPQGQWGSDDANVTDDVPS